MSGPEPGTTRLVADVGGTNTRIALYDPAAGELLEPASYVNREYPRLEDVITHWLEGISRSRPRSCCIAVAAPISGDRVAMVNMDWSFSCSDLAGQFGFTQLRCINDFESNAYSLPHLGDDDIQLLHAGEKGPAGKLATIGPGTGLGGAILDCVGQPSTTYACEPGHMGLSAGTELELELFRVLMCHHSDIYAELLVSGPGLQRLYLALCEVRGEPAQPLSAAEISDRGLHDTDATCVMVLDTFCALLGSICGDFLLANGAYGGLYLAGGIVPRMYTFLQNSTFHRRLVEKGTMRDRLGAIPVYAITGGHPGLIGAAHAPL